MKMEIQINQLIMTLKENINQN